MGIRAELKIDSPPGCPVASISEFPGATSTDINKTSGSGSRNIVTEEFVLDSDASPESFQAYGVESELQEVFSYSSKHIYRFTRSQNHCVCECLEAFDCPVTDVFAKDGTLYVAFHSANIEQLKSVLTGLRNEWTDVTVKRLLHSSTDGTDNDLILLDRSILTTRQREVLKTAHDMGYFEHGQGANAGEVARALDINTSTFTETLRAAQRKLLKTILDS